MNIIVHLLNDGQASALKSFLLRAIYFQKTQGNTVSTDESDADFLDLYGYTKEDLLAAVTALEKAIL